MKVLIVEDNWGKIERLIRVLDDLRIKEFRIEINTENALERATSEEFDVLITDITLPRMQHQKAEAKNGRNMLMDLARQNICLPTIIYSCTPISEEFLKELKDLEYSEIEHVMDDVIVKACLKKWQK